LKTKRLLVAFLAALMAVGAYAGVQQVLHGDEVTGLGTLGAGGVVWGLYVVGDGFFASVGLASLVLAAILRVWREPRLEASAQIAVALGMASLLASVLCVLADLGRAWTALINLSLVGRARAPFFATFTLVAGASSFGALVQWFLASRAGWAERAQVRGGRIWRFLARGPQGTASAAHRRAKVNFWYSLVLLPLFLLGLVILARVFCVRPGRPVALVHFEVVTFMLSAGAAACSLVLLGSPQGARVTLARILSPMVTLTAFLVVLGEILALRSPGAAMRGFSRALLDGPWQGWFWTDVVLFIVASALLLSVLGRGQVSKNRAAPVACLVCLAVFLQRYLLLVAWQTHGQALSWPQGLYRPTAIEWAVVIGIAALAASASWVLASLGPSRGVAVGPSGLEGGRLRSWLASACVFLGGVGVAAGLALSAGVASGDFLDPITAGGPLVFLIGLLIALSAPAIYELWPET